jgi:predicted Zn-dependent protease
LLVDELGRAWKVLDVRDEKPHYAAVSVQDAWTLSIGASAGAVSRDQDTNRRYLDVDLRVGTPELDSTHALRGFSSLEEDSRDRIAAPTSDGWALRQAVWRAIDQGYRDGVEHLVMLRANQTVKAEEEDPAPDFEVREPVVDRKSVPPELSVDRKAWEELLTEVSTHLDRSAVVEDSEASLDAGRKVETFVDTEGARLVDGSVHLRLAISVSSIADDGDDVHVYRAVDVHDPSRLPERGAILAWADQAVADLEALRSAPRGEPYSGPVLLRGRAAGVFFHEVVGHRVEGHRQKDDDEGKTFSDSLGKRIFPSWLDVYDDPTIEQMAGEDLNGFYSFDDEGVPAARAQIVDDGVFRGYLMGRSPIPGFEHSNGHGRRSTGRWPNARMGNTIVQASKSVPYSQLRAMLLADVRKQGLPYGYIVDDIEGGFTLTGRVTPNAFNVRANTTWRVYADGRPDQLVRGIDLVGTPFVAFGNLEAAGDDPSVFNGVCGAESGWVPVSAVAPSLLFSKLEFQLKEKGEDRPPLLPKPTEMANAMLGVTP